MHLTTAIMCKQQVATIGCGTLSQTESAKTWLQKKLSPLRDAAWVCICSTLGSGAAERKTAGATKLLLSKPMSGIMEGITERHTN